MQAQDILQHGAFLRAEIVGERGVVEGVLDIVTNRGPAQTEQRAQSLQNRDALSPGTSIAGVVCVAVRRAHGQESLRVCCRYRDYRRQIDARCEFPSPPSPLLRPRL